MSPLLLWLVGDGYAHKLHDSPDNVKHSWKDNANEQKYEGVIDDALHDWYAFGLLGNRGFLIHF